MVRILICLLYTSDAADEEDSVDLGGRRIIKKNIQEIIENTAEQDHVTVEIDNAKELVGKDLNKHIKNLEKKMNEFASKLEFEDAARLRDEINRLKAKEVGLSNKVLQFKKN